MVWISLSGSQETVYNSDMGAIKISGDGIISPRVYGALLGFAMGIPGFARAADDYSGIPPAQNQVDSALHTVLLVAGMLVILILVAIAIIVFRKVFTLPAGETPGPDANPLAEASAEEHRGNIGAAASRYEAAGEKIKAAECWEKIKDFTRAAECWEAGGDLERAARLHVRAGSALRAAGIYMQSNNYIEAAKIFRNKGDHLRTAQALELYGNKLAAAREYSAASNHAYAARLLEQERMYVEAAEAYQPLVVEDVITTASADRFSVYAGLLALAGEKDRAVEIYRRVLQVMPRHSVALSALRDLVPPNPVEPAVETVATQPAAALDAPIPPPSPTTEERAQEAVPDTAGDPAEPLRHDFTLRSMILAGRLEPRYSMRLWVQVMRALAELHGANVVLGNLSPDSIVIDMENNVSIENPPVHAAIYQSPEVQAGQSPDRQADIYSMGVILYELVGGSLDQFRKKRAGELFSDVPPWLDELIERCTEKSLTGRFQSIEEVSAAILKLMTATKA